MQQIRQPQQIKKFISGNFFQKSIEDIIIVQEFQLVHFDASQFQSILETNIKILDAISVTDQSNLDLIAILYITGDIEIYSPFEKQIKNIIMKKCEKKKPYKLYYNNNQIYLLDYIDGMTKINLQTQAIEVVADIRSKVVHMQYLEYNFIVVYFEKNILRLKGMNAKFSLAFKYQHYSLNQKIVIFKHLIIFYSFKTMKIYNQVSGQVQAEYDKLLSSNIVDIFQMDEDELKLIIVLQNGWIDQITCSQTNMFNHQNLYQLPMSNIILCHKTEKQQFCILSTDKVAIFNKNFELKFQETMFNIFTRIFENNNNLYAAQLKGLCQIKKFRKIQNKQLIIRKFQFENVKFFFQTSENMLVITTNVVSLYYDNQLFSQFQSSIEIEFAIIVEKQYLIISNQQVLQLLLIDANQIIYKAQLNQDTLILQSHTQNKFSVYTEDGKIKIFNIVDAVINFATEIGQYYDITMYNFQWQNHCLISFFDCTVSLYTYKDFQLQQQKELAKQKINSICISMYYHDEIYCLITQNCWLYRVNSVLEVLESIQLLGIGMLVQNIFTGNNFSLIQTELNGKRIYEMIDNNEQFILKSQVDEQLYANNQGELFSVHQSDIYKLEIDYKREYDFFETNILSTQEQVINFKYNFLITNNIIYLVSLERLNILYQNQQNKFVLSDITQNYIALSDQNQQLQIFQIYVGQKLTQEIKEIKVFQFENKKITAFKISEDILILGIWNEIQIFSLQTFQKLESFKAIFPSINYSIENETKQITIQQHSENQLVFDLLIDKAGIVIITMKISQSNETKFFRVDKKFYSPIIGCRNLRMEQIQNYWQLFNAKGECLKFKLTKYFFDQFLQPIDEKNKQIINDLIVDTVNYKSSKFYIGICGGIWIHDL